MGVWGWNVWLGYIWMLTSVIGCFVGRWVVGLFAVGRDFRIRRRSVLVLLLPVVLVLWMVGWVLCYSGSSDDRRRRVPPAAVKDDGVEVRVGLLEEDVEAEG
jgi:hypothetical protein